MAFHVFQTGYTGSADDAMDNFYWIGQGDRLPMGGANLDTTNAAYNVGEDIYRWYTIYACNLNITGEISKTWNLIAETTTTLATGAITFSGLNGDTDKCYHIICNILCSQGSIEQQLLISPNGLSGTNFGYEYIYAGAAVVGATRGSGTSFWVAVVETGLTTASLVNRVELYMWAKTGQERCVIENYVRSANGVYIQYLEMRGLIWNDTSTTITSLKFYGATTVSFLAGTNIQIWAQR